MRDLDSYELSEWIAYWQIEHIGAPEERADLRNGIAVANNWNIALAKAGDDTRVDADDFIPRWEDESDGSASNIDPELFSLMMRARFPQAG